jgi:hypothetical protein
MKKLLILAPLALVILTGCQSMGGNDGAWFALFNGKDLTGWRASETPECFSVADGVLVVKGGRSHLFYEGIVNSGDFKNFHLSAEVKTTPGSNAGIYFHTEYQEEGWPDKGYEVQVNVSHTDTVKGGSLYAIDNIGELYARDGEWYTQEIIVRGKRIVSKINGETLVDYTEPDDVVREEMTGRLIDRGAIAIQAHDPDSTIYFRNIKIKPLP